MSDLIDRQAVIDAMEQAKKQYIDRRVIIGKMQDIVNNLPSAQPEIIWCKDCKHWDTTWQNDWAPNYHYCPMIDGTRRDDFYCADAEMRGEE